LRLPPQAQSRTSRPWTLRIGSAQRTHFGGLRAGFALVLHGFGEQAVGAGRQDA
jgi:hypothetical protein